MLEQRLVMAASGIQAVHRSGQTFVTWTEDGAVTGESYNVYRSSSPITTANIAQAEKLTAKWGPLDDNTSVNVGAAPGVGVPANFVIEDLGTPLSDSTGLFVYTTPAAQSGTWYYAVTEVIAGNESTVLTAGSNSLSTGVSETVATPSPVLTVSVNSGHGRIYTQFMDYAKWNPTFQGYAYNYSVALPYNYDPQVQWPIRLMPHAYGERFRLETESEYQWQCIEVFLDDPGSYSNGTQTWWYGFGADHNYTTGGNIPTSGRIENFTEQRVLKTVDEVVTLVNGNPLRVMSQGNSMGASGSLSLGIRYPNIMNAIFASEPMTNYQSSPTFANDFERLWGTKAANLPIVSNGPYATALKQYDGTGVYTWMNHQTGLVARRGAETAFLMVGHGKGDTTIDWLTQGKPFIAALNAANVGFTAEQRDAWDHTWMGFGFSVGTVMSPTGSDDLHDLAYDRTLSFPSFTNATGSGPNVPGSTGTDQYNLQFEWASSVNTFHTGIIDTPTRYEISVRSTTAAQVSEVTPRRLQQFRAPAGTVVRWKNVNNATGATVQSGTVTTGADGLVTIPRMQIGTNTGNRLVLERGTVSPVISQPSGAVLSQTPTIQWGLTTDAVSYDVWISNVSNTAVPPRRFTVSGTSWASSTPMGIGRYTVWVRGIRANNSFTAWSAPVNFQIASRVTVVDVPARVTNATPTFSWPSLPGAARYDLWLSNLTTGQTQYIRNSNITTTSFQPTSPIAIGNYTLWVRGIDAGGYGGNWSLPDTFTVAPRATLTGPEAVSITSTPEFQWQSVAGAVSYDILIQPRVGSTVTASANGLTTTSWTPSSPIADGEYRWWVRANGVPGIAVTWSDTRLLIIGGRPSFTIPSGTASSRTPTITWAPVTGAVRYELWMTRLSNGAVTNLTNLTTTSYSPPTDLAPGTYRFWVRAVSASNRFSAYSTAIDLTIVQTEDPQNTGDNTLAVRMISQVFSEFALNGELTDRSSFGSIQRAEVLPETDVAANTQPVQSSESAVETDSLRSIPRTSASFIPAMIEQSQDRVPKAVLLAMATTPEPVLQKRVAASENQHSADEHLDQRIP